MERILVVANDSVEPEALEGVTRGRSVEVLVIAPALNSRLRHWVSDVDDARRAAGLRLGRCLQLLGAHGIRADGWVGDADPLLAIGDALRFFDADEIVISTRTNGASHRNERNLVLRARVRYSRPVFAA